MSELRAVLFDMDGTLLDSEKLWDVAVYELSADLGAEMTAEVRQSTLGNSMMGALRIVHTHAGHPVETEHLEASAARLRARVAELFGEGLPWRPGAEETLDRVARAGLDIALVTNTERELTELALDTLGRHRFQATVCGDEVRAPKPEPDPYRRAAQLLGVEVNHTLAVEDSPTGARSADAAGCAVLAVPSDVEIPPGPRRVHRSSLLGLTVDELREAFAVVASRTGDAAWNNRRP